MTKEDLIKNITANEYTMMDAVQSLGGRASCQDDRTFFCAMRSCQFRSWNEETLESYAEDLEAAASAGRNLVSEKYGRMMEQTDPVNYEKIRDQLPAVSEETCALVEQACETAVAWQAEAMEQYPYLTAHGRSLEDNQKSHIGGTAFHNYLRSELMTYSDKTIRLYSAMVNEKKSAGINMNLENLLENIRFYGFASLEEAEAQAKAKTVL